MLPFRADYECLGPLVPDAIRVGVGALPVERGVDPRLQRGFAGQARRQLEGYSRILADKDAFLDLGNVSVFAAGVK